MQIDAPKKMKIAHKCRLMDSFHFLGLINVREFIARKKSEKKH